MKIYQLEFLKDMARGINSVFGDRCEVAVHDFSNLKSSLVYLVGNVTNRPLGSSIPDMLYRLLKEFGDEAPNKLGYKSTTEDGKVIKCSTTMFRNEEGKIVGCLCINFNVTDFAYLATAFNDFTFIPQESVGHDGRSTENGMSTNFGERLMEQRLSLPSLVHDLNSDGRLSDSDLKNIGNAAVGTVHPLVYLAEQKLPS